MSADSYDPGRKPAPGNPIDYTHPYCLGQIGWWMMNESGGVTVRDWSGYGNHGTSNGPMWTDGSLSYNGSSDFVDIGDKAVFDSLSAITVSAWIYVPTLDTATHDICGKRVAAGDSWRLRLDNKRLYWITDTGSPAQSAWAANISAHTWYHIVGTYDGANQKLYGNSVLRDTDAQTGTMGDVTESVHIGAEPKATPEDFFLGFIDEVRIYNRALSASEIDAQYRDRMQGLYAEFPRISPAMWHVEESEGLSIPTAMHHYRQQRM